MFDLIILLIVIKIIISVANRNKTGKKKDASARPNEPRKHGFGGFPFGNAREWASKRMPEAEGLTRHTASLQRTGAGTEILKPGEPADQRHGRQRGRSGDVPETAGAAAVYGYPGDCKADELHHVPGYP